MIFFNPLSVPEHMSFICMDTPVGYRLQHSWDSARPDYLLAGSCTCILSRLPQEAIVCLTSLSLLTSCRGSAHSRSRCQIQQVSPFEQLTRAADSPGLCHMFIPVRVPLVQPSEPLEHHSPGDRSSAFESEIEKERILTYWRACVQTAPRALCNTPGRWGQVPSQASFDRFTYFLSICYVPNTLLVVNRTKILVHGELTF